MTGEDYENERLLREADLEDSDADSDLDDGDGESYEPGRGAGSGRGGGGGGGSALAGMEIGEGDQTEFTEVRFFPQGSRKAHAAAAR